MSSQPAVVFEDVSYTYDARPDAGDNPGRHALAAVTLAVDPGEFVAIIGHNGSGKSTLAKHINALFKPTRGRVLTAGMCTDDDELVFEIRSHAGMVFQNPDAQMVASVVADDVAFGPENLAVPYDELVQRVSDSLDAVKMAPFSDADPTHLSGGQKQRVCIAGVLAMDPDILVLDEPGAMLDPRGRRGIRRVVRELNRKGMTVVLITHQMEEAVLANRVLVMHRGQVVLSGTPLEVFSQKKRLRELSMEVPFSLLLSEELRRRGIEVDELARPEDIKDELAALLARRPATGVTRKDPAPSPTHHPEPSPCHPEQPSPCHPERSEGTVPAGHPDTAKASADPSPVSTPALTLDHASYTYTSLERSTEALRDVCLTLPRGAFLGVIGHTGSGKSTLVQLISGLLATTTGRVLLGTDDLADKTVRRTLHSRVGVAFQYPEYQLFATTVADDIAFGPRNAGLSAPEVQSKVQQACNMVGLDFDTYAGRSPFELSGGEKRRVALAGVIATQPELLILDEPTAGLDPAAHRSLLDFVKRYNDQGNTVVMVSHNMDDIALLSSHIIVLNEGAIYLQGTPTEVFSHPVKLRAINLGVPQATTYALDLIDRGYPISPALLTSAELAEAIAEVLRG